MFEHLTQLTDAQIFAIISCFFMAASIFAILILRTFFSVKLRYRDNAGVANMSALISIIYGVLVGFTALYLFNNNSLTADAVQHEANSVANVYRDSKWLQVSVKDKIQALIAKYIEEVITVEWPLMAKGGAIPTTGDRIIDAIADNVMTQSNLSLAGTMVQRDLLEQINFLYNARHQRINLSNFTLNFEVWVVILIGTILTITINYLFKMSFYFHIITISMAALMTSAMLFLLVTLDRPFQGEFVIGPDAFKDVQSYIKNTSPSITLDNQT
jgi:magnesium-transporting ATPase (P-type)